VANTCSPRAASDGPCLTNGDCGPDAPYCDPNAHYVCTIGLTFGTGSDDCNGIVGMAPGAGGNAPMDAGTE
jgi:hypothetical protein